MANYRINLPDLNNPSLFAAWGNYLERETIQAFKKERAPFGNNWASLKPSTIKRKAERKFPRSRNKILRDTGTLYDSFVVNLLPNGVEFGTGIKVGGYSLGAIHQYGAPRRNIPARPFLPLDASGQLLPQASEKIRQITEDFLRQQLEKF